VYVVGIAGAVLCVIVMYGLPRMAWERFGIWLALGMAVYLFYGFWHSNLRRASRQAPAAGDD
jgi:APA family basic amino acid/polyamine antiporter